MDVLRLSAAGSWVPCSGYPRLAAQFPNLESEAAKEGTAAHSMGEAVLKGEVSDVSELVDRAAPNGVIMTSDMAEHVQFYIDTVRAPGLPLDVEGFTVLESATLPVKIQGTADAKALAPDLWLNIWDLKFGWGIVDAVGNWQIAGYGIGHAMAAIKQGYNVQGVHLHIVQPRPHHPAGRVRTWSVPIEKLWDLWATMYASATKATGANPELVTGEHCKHCPALHACPSARAASLNAVDVTNALFSDNVPPEVMASEIETLRRASSAIKLRLEAMERQAIDTLKGGGMLPGWALETSSGQRKWRNAAEVGTLELLTGKDLHERKPLSPYQCEQNGVDSKMVNAYTTNAATGFKLVACDLNQKAEKVFGT